MKNLSIFCYIIKNSLKFSMKDTEFKLWHYWFKKILQYFLLRELSISPSRLEDKKWSPASISTPSVSSAMSATDSRCKLRSPQVSRHNIEVCNLGAFEIIGNASSYIKLVQFCMKLIRCSVLMVHCALWDELYPMLTNTVKILQISYAFTVIGALNTCTYFQNHEKFCMNI